MTRRSPDIGIKSMPWVAGVALLIATACGESTPPLTPAISTIHVSASRSSIVLGDSVQVGATATTADGYPFPLGAVAWTSSDTAVATVTATGPLTAIVRTISVGSVSITASVESHSGYLALAVTAPPPPPPPPPQKSPPLAFIWSSETGMIALTFPSGVTRSYANDINDLGQVVGVVIIDDQSHAFVWTRDGGMTDIGGPSGYVDSYAVAINNAGQVAGGFRDASGHIRPFRWSPSEGMIKLPMPPGTTNAFARGINAGGDVVGERDGSAELVPFRWTQAKGTEQLPLFESDSWGAATDIADNGDVVGYSTKYDRDYDISRSVRWSPNGAITIIDACTGGYIAYDYSYVCHSSPSAINGSGQIAGNSGGGPSIAVRMTLGGLEHIPLIPGSSTNYASAINEAGQVVGYSYWTALEVGRAFLWSPISGTVDLGALPDRKWSSATGINNRGEVVGWSY